MTRLKSHVLPFTTIVEGGELDAVIYLHREGCPWNEEVCTAAAGKGHLECLQYLHREGCPWNASMCRNAAESGKLDCLQFLHEHGFPWDEETTLHTAANGHASCLEYAITQGCPVQQDICLRMFATNSHFFSSCKRAGCLKYLHNLGYKITGAVTTAAKNVDDAPCLEYIASIRKRGRSSIIEQYMDDMTPRYDVDMSRESVQSRTWPNGKEVMVIVSGTSVQFVDVPYEA